MTFAEFLILVLVSIGLYYLMRPLQAYLEKRILRFLRSKKDPNGKPIINITDYKKKDDL